MKIALITYSADPARGGAEGYTIELAEALIRRGNDVSVLHYTPLRNNCSTSLNYIQVEKRRRTKAAQYLEFIDAVDEHIAQGQFDIVHAMLPVRRCDIYQPHAGLAIEAINGNNKRRQGLGRFLARIGNQLNSKRQLYARVERNLLTSPSAPTIICLSEAMKTKVASAIGRSHARLSVIYNAVDLARYDKNLDPTAGTRLREKFNITPDQTVALFIAQDFERKGLAVSLKAIAEARHQALRLIVVGSDKSEPYQRLADTLGISRSVIFAGGVRDPYPFYAAADIVLFPSLFDPFGLVPAESVAMGVPPIISRQCGVSELLTHNHDALIIENPEQISELVSAINTSLEPGVRQRLASNCIQTRQKFSYEKHLDLILQHYHARIGSS